MKTLGKEGHFVLLYGKNNPQFKKDFLKCAKNVYNEKSVSKCHWWQKIKTSLGPKLNNIFMHNIEWTVPW